MKGKHHQTELRRQLMVRANKREPSAQCTERKFIKSLTTIPVAVAHASVASGKPNV